jgi:PAS domain S-box-containing protein
VALNAQALRYKTLMETSTDSIYVINEKGDLQEANAAFLRRRGYTAAELKGLNVADWDAQWSSEQLQERIRQLVGSSAVFETRHRRKDGSVFDVEVCATTVRIGREQLFFAVARDITERKRVGRALDERLRFETLLTELSAAFANLVTTEVDREIDQWLQTLTEFLGVDRASFFQFEEDGTKLYRSHSYTVPGIEPLPQSPAGMKEQFPWITEQLRRGVIVKWSRIPDDMPEEAAKEKEYAAKLGVKSGLNIPVLMDGSVICAISFTSIVAYRDWPDAMVARLRLVGEIFAAALERKRAEAALRESEERFRQIAENLQDVIYMADSKVERLLYVNPAYEQIWGASAASLYQDVRAFMEPIHPDDREIVARVLQEQKEAKCVTVEYRIIRPDGAIHWIRDRSFPVRNAEGEVYRIAGVAGDISESKQREDQLRQSEKQLAEAQHIANVGSWNWDLQSNAASWSDELYRIFGVDRQAFNPAYEEFVAEFVHPEDRALVRGVVESCLKTQQPFSLYYRIIRPDGGQRFIHARGNIVSDEHGNPIRAFGTAQDVTERKQTEEALREAEQKYRDIFENAGEGIFQSTPDGRYIAANPALARMYRFTSPEELIHSLQDISRQVYVDSTRRDEFKRQIEEQGAVRGFEEEVFCKDGSRLWISVNARVVRDGQGAIRYYEGTVQDITERKAAAKELEEANNQLRLLSRRLFDAHEEERRHLARELHDEIGQALTAAKINLQSVAGNGGNADIPRLRETIAILDRLLGQVRQISLDLRPSMLDDLGLVPALRSLLDQQGRRASIEVRFFAEDIPEKLDPEIQTTCFRIAQEAITNTVRHAHARRIDLDLRRDDGNLRVMIRDDGGGFDAASVEGHTVGLGLIGIKERAALVGGRVQIISSPKKGTAVKISLPLHPPRNTAIPRPNPLCMRQSA